MATIVEFYKFNAKRKIGLRVCVTKLCEFHSIGLQKLPLRNLKEIKDSAEKRAVKSAKEKAAKNHENLQLLALAKYFVITQTHNGDKVDRLGILVGIENSIPSNPQGTSAKRRRTTPSQRPAGDSAGVSARCLGVALPVPLSPTRYMPPPASAHRPLVTPMAQVMNAPDLMLLVRAAEIDRKNNSWRFGVGPLPTV